MSKTTWVTLYLPTDVYFFKQSRFSVARAHEINTFLPLQLLFVPPSISSFSCSFYTHFMSFSGLLKIANFGIRWNDINFRRFFLFCFFLVFFFKTLTAEYTSILEIIGKNYRYQFSCNYLKKPKTFVETVNGPLKIFKRIFSLLIRQHPFHYLFGCCSRVNFFNIQNNNIFPETLSPNFWKGFIVSPKTSR